MSGDADGPTVDRISALLSQALGTPVRVKVAGRIGPWAVQRCHLEPAPGVPASVIVKWLRADPHGFRIDPRQVATEQAALEFLAGIGFAKAPRLIAADRAAGVLVLEDLAPREPLADLLRRRPVAELTAERLAFATAMGELNAATVGREAAYLAIRSGYGDTDPEAGRERRLGPLWDDAQSHLADLGLPMSASAQADTADVVEALLRPGPFLAFSNGDPEVNNFMVAGADGRLIDFESAAFRHALTCATWIHTPASAWVVVQDPIAADLEAAYRRALAVGVPEAEDDRLFGDGMGVAVLALALDRISRFRRLDFRPAGDLSRVQIIATLESAAAACRRHRAFPALTGWTNRAAEWLRHRWPDANVDLAGYAPYTPRH